VILFLVLWLILVGLSGIHGLVTRLMTRREDSVVTQFGYSVGFNNSLGV